MGHKDLLLPAWIAILLLGTQITLSKGRIFSSTPRSQLIPKESTADVTFECRVEDGLTNTNYTWYKNDIPVVIDGFRHNLYVGNLVISRPVSSDAGKYRCVINSNEGAASTNYAELTFAHLDQSSNTEETSLTTPQSQGVELECGEIDYSPEFSIFFAWDNTATLERIAPLGNENHFISQKTGNLYIANPQPGDSGKYQCTAISVWELSNVRATASGNKVNLKVQDSNANYSPELMVKPASTTTVELNGKTYIECYASGNPTPTINWTKDGSEELPGSAQITASGQLVFMDVGEDVEGTYTCMATNNQGFARASGNLELNYPPRWEREISNGDYDLASTVSWTCTSKAVPAAEYSWYKNTKEIDAEADPRITIEENEDGSSTLTIEDLNENDGGIYQCVATNNLGNAVSAAKLIVNSYAPDIDPDVLSITYAGLSQESTIQCIHTAAPKGTILWTKDGVELKSGLKYDIHDDGSLVISNITKDDEGSYTCKVINILGEASSTGYLKAYEATKITEDPSDVYTTAGNSISLICDAEYDSALQMNWEWKHDDEVVGDFDLQYMKSGGTLQISAITSDESGLYTCCAITKVNSPCGSATVYVTAPPNSPEEVMVTTSTSSSQDLKWKAPFDNHSPIVSYSVEYRNSYDDDWMPANTDPPMVNATRCTVTDLYPYNTYIYRVYATNELGTSKPSEESPVENTNRGAPPKAPRLKKGGGGDIGQLIVAWKALEQKYYGAEDIEYVVAIQKIPDGEPSILPLPIPNQNSTEEEKDDEDDWLETTVDGKATNHTFQVKDDEIWAPYNVKIKASNEIGDGPWSRIHVVHTFEIAPDTKPQNVRQGKYKPRAYSANLAWDSLYSENGRITGYYVKIVLKAGPNSGDEVMETKAKLPKILVDGLTSNTVYEAMVAGYNSAGQGPWSDPFTFNTAKKPPSVAPKSVKVTIKNLVLSASWDPIIYENGQPIDEASLLGYKVQYWWSNKTSAFARTKSTILNDLDVTLANNSRYNVWVRGYSEGGDGVPSQIFQVSTGTTTTGAQQCCGAEAIKFNSAVIMIVTLLWMLFIKLDL